MAAPIEYAALRIFSLDTVRQAQRAQLDIYNYGIRTQNSGYLTTLLGAVATVLSYIFLKSTAVSLATGSISTALSLVPSEKSILEFQMLQGNNFLQTLENFFEDNPQYDLIEANVPFKEFPDQGWRCVTGTGVITRVHSSSGGWIIM